jgi:transposase
MARGDIIIMKAKELKRIPVIYSVINKQITQVEAASILGLSRRQIIRLTKKVKQNGDAAFIHRSRGKPSNRAELPEAKQKILDLCKNSYQGFGPTFAAEMLFEKNKLHINPETLRLWFIENNIEYKKRKAPKHRSWRPRKDSFGYMVQMDGSHHDWLEGRGPWCVLMGYIDDATGRIYANFYDYEGTKPAFDSFKRYIKRYGIPQSIYLDKHSTYKSTKKQTLEDELNNVKSMSQFERALEELGVDVIHANSPQAKGRIERSFKTHQDRLVKGLRLDGINNIEDANKFLHTYYMPKHNRKFAVIAKDKVNLHNPVPKHVDLDRIFCKKYKAALRKDFTIQHDSKLYQVLDSTRAKEVTIEERLNGKLYIYYKDTQLEYKLIDKRPQKPQQKKLYKPRKKYVPPAGHLYKMLYNRYKRKCA